MQQTYIVVYYEVLKKNIKVEFILNPKKVHDFIMIYVGNTNYE